MRCKTVLDRLDDHVDGLLAAPEAEAVRDHLDDCTDCRETSLALTAACSSLSKWDDAEPPARCFDEILARIDALPAEALARPARRGLFSRLPRFESVRAARARWFATSGLAAAAAVLAAVQISETETRIVRRSAPRLTTSLASAPRTPFFQGYDFDNGLLYRGPDRGTDRGTVRPAARPAHAAPRMDLLEGAAK